MLATCFIAIVCIVAVLFVSLSAAFAILLLGKLGMRDCIVTKAPKLISQLFDCDFCLSFWVAVVISSFLAILFCEVSLLFIPVLSTPITRFLL